MVKCLLLKKYSSEKYQTFKISLLKSDFFKIIKYFTKYNEFLI